MMQVTRIYLYPLGGVVVHFILCIYTMLMIGVVIDEYFVPSLEIIAEGNRPYYITH